MMVEITFPRAWPADLKILGLSFDVEALAKLSPSAGGGIVSINLGPDLWKASYTSPPLTERALGELRAWYATLTSVESFYGFDVLREYPLAYPDGLDGFDGACGLGGVTTAKLVALTELPVGYIASVGDYLAFDYGANGSRALHMIAAGGVADGAGNLEVEVRPHIRLGWEVAGAVSLYRASAEMIIRPGSFSAPVSLDRTAVVSFDAIQRVR